MSNPHTGAYSENWTEAGREAAERSARKEAETRERREQILDYYKRGRRKQHGRTETGDYHAR